MNGRLYFVVDDRTRPGYEQAGSKPFSYATKRARVDVRRYFEVPCDASEDPLELLAKAREAILVAGL
jgi:DNA transformation protein